MSETQKQGERKGLKLREQPRSPVKARGLTENEKRLDPTILNTAILDEIADRLYHMEQYMGEERIEGVVDTRENIIVTEAGLSIIPPKAWFSFVLINDGPDSLSVIVNRDRSIDTHLMYSGETYAIDMHRARVTDLFLTCEHGDRATIRLVGTH